jgi:hypothetical protein
VTLRREFIGKMPDHAQACAAMLPIERVMLRRARNLQLIT